MKDFIIILAEHPLIITAPFIISVGILLLFFVFVLINVYEVIIEVLYIWYALMIKPFTKKGREESQRYSRQEKEAKLNFDKTITEMGLTMKEREVLIQYLQDNGRRGSYYESAAEIREALAEIETKENEKNNEPPIAEK